MRIDLFVSDSFRLAGRKLSRPYDLRRLVEVKDLQGTPKPSVIVGTARELSGIHPQKLNGLIPAGLRVIVMEAVPGTPMPRFPKEVIHCTLPHLEKRDEWRILSALLNNAIDLLVLKSSERRTQKFLAELTKIGVLLSSEKDSNRLLELILTKSREITYCDAGSLYLVQDDGAERHLLFKMAQNDSIELNLGEFPMPLNEQSLAGYVVLSGEPLLIDNAYEIDPYKPYSHARWVDKKNNYRTITSLTVPLKNLKGEVLGALQLINRKRERNIRLIDPLTAMVVVQPFDDDSVELVTSLASLAAVTLEKNMLYEEIQNLFEGFVRASVKAIESRDPTTRGHSERVALLTVELARQVNACDSGKYANVTFSEENIRELRYAALLHDFGKVGVREHVLVKEKKLSPGQSDVLRMRARFIKAAMVSENWRKRLDWILDNGADEYSKMEERFEKDLEDLMELLDSDLDLVWNANEPSFLSDDKSKRLKGLLKHVYAEFDRKPVQILTPDEVRVLSIPKGTLTDEERLEIESHVTHTYHFLRMIPWTKELRDVPQIAYKHHEKLNRKGYPQGLASPDIPLQSRMMAICDIFDALSASDRPYKKAVPVGKSLDILGYEAKDGMLDQSLVDLFTESGAYKVVEKKS